MSISLWLTDAIVLLAFAGVAVDESDKWHNFSCFWIGMESWNGVCNDIMRHDFISDSQHARIDRQKTVIDVDCCLCEQFRILWLSWFKYISVLLQFFFWYLVYYISSCLGYSCVGTCDQLHCFNVSSHLPKRQSQFITHRGQSKDKVKLTNR